MAVADSSLFWASKVRRCDRHTAGISGASFVLEVASTEVFKSVAVACGGEVDRGQSSMLRQAGLYTAALTDDRDLRTTVPRRGR